MIKTLSLEFFKIRGKHILTMIILFLMVEMFWAFTSITRSISENPDEAVWESVIYIVSSMNGLFMPILTAIVVSRICDMEHKGDTWKMLVATNVSRGQIYAAKYICANILLLFVILLQAILIVIYGLINHFPGGVPISLFIQFLIGSFITTFAITALQQWLSLAIKNQAFALCAGMIGGFIGMTAAMFPASIRQIFIWSYYLDLSPVSYSYSESSGAVYMVDHLGISLIIMALIICIILYIAGKTHVTRQEI